VAQLGARLDGIEEVVGSNPIGSTKVLTLIKPMAKLTFLGAAGTVTGSKYLVEAVGKRLVVDCGLFQGSQELQDLNYKPLTVDPKTIDYLAGRAGC
jgi:hypothetical protein